MNHKMSAVEWLRSMTPEEAEAMPSTVKARAALLMAAAEAGTIEEQQKPQPPGGSRSQMTVREKCDYIKTWGEDAYEALED